MSVYEDISTCTLGSTTITTIQQITSNLVAPKAGVGGDAAAFDTAVVSGRKSRNGTITLLDSSQARALEGATGTLSFTGKDTGGGSDDAITIVNVAIANVSTTDSHGAPGMATLDWIAYSADGIADPQS